MRWQRDVRIQGFPADEVRFVMGNLEIVLPSVVNAPGLHYAVCMIDVIKKSLLAGIGATVVTAEMLEKSLNEWVEKGKISTDEAKELAEQILEDSRKEYQQARQQVEGWFEENIEKAGLVRKSRLESMEKRLNELEAELQKLKKASS